MKLSNQQMIKGIVSNDRAVLESVYSTYFPMIKSMVLKNSGDATAAVDVFHDGLVVLFEKLGQSDETDHIVVGAYLQGICKNIWLYQLRRSKMGKEKEASVAETVSGNLEETLSEDWLHSQQLELYRKHFKELGEDCQRVLQLFFDKKSLKEIAEIMGFSDQYAKKRKYTCQKQLIQFIENDPLYQELLSYST